MKSVKLGLLAFALLMAKQATAQLEIFPKPYKNNALWTVGGKLVDTLYMGASFTRTSFKPVTVSLKGNEAGWSGDLLFIDPKTGVEDRLFSNHDPVGTTVVLSDRHDIAIGDTVYFVYKVTSPVNGNFPSANSRLPKYTGPNIPGVSKYVTGPMSAKWGHRWSVAGRMNDSTVIFGFEDNVEPTSDFDYDDIVFLTSLSLANDEVPAQLTFTDKTGKPLKSGDFYSPANDSVYLVYTDDYNAGKDPVVFNITVKNRRGTVAADNESFTGVVPTRNGITGTWSIAIPLNEAPGIPGDKKLQVYVLGEITATVASHTRNQIPDGNTLTANLNVAYPDKPETVKITDCADTTADIVRTTNCIQIKVGDQSFTRGQDTVWAEVKCDQSGDVIGKVPLIEQVGGGYVSGNIVKNETNPPGAGDQILSCKTTDNVIVTYVDEVYDKRATDQKSFNGNAAESFNYVQTASPATVITTITDGEAATFTAVIKAPTPTVGVVDQIDVTMTIANGDKETFKATETGPNTGVFTVDIPYGFATTPAVAGDGKVDGFLDPTQAVISVKVDGSAIVNGKTYTASITLKPALNLAKGAYIKDTDGDGRGDKVYIVFSRPLEAVPTSLTPTYWNQVAPGFANTAPPVLSIKPDAPNVLVADFSASPFPKGATSIPVGQTPFATLPGDNIFGGQKPAIADSIGPIIDSARIRPFNNLNLSTNSTELNVDTLRVYISEQLKTQADWADLIRFSKPVNGACTDYARSTPVVSAGQPTDNGDGSFTFLVAAGNGPSPISGDCIFVNVNGTYTDMKNNVPPIHGEMIKGNKMLPGIELFRGYPPVAGMDAGLPGFVVVNNDPQSDLGSEYSKKTATGFQTYWVPPADFPKNYREGDIYYPVIPAINANVQPGVDQGARVPMPSGISTVQVVSTSEYIADVAIFDNLGNFVKAFKQSFGYFGELNNQERAAKRGLVSYLVWDMKNVKGQKAGQGVYVWKVVFRFKNGKQEIQYTRTGLMRSSTLYRPGVKTP